MIRKPVLLAAAMILLLGWCASPSAMAQGCSMCGTALKDSSDPLTRSIASSTLFMMSMPFLLVVSAAGWVVYCHRRPRTGNEPGPAITQEENTR